MKKDNVHTITTGKAYLKLGAIPTGDFLVNRATGQGTKADKDYYNRFVDRGNIDVGQINALYKNSWIAAKIVDALPHDMVRAWRKFEGMKAKQEAEYLEAESFFDVIAKIESCLKAARKYGGAALILGVNGSTDAETPLKPKDYKKGCLDFIHSVDCTELSIHEIEKDAFNINYDKPKFYKMDRTTIHHSRVIPFYGIRLSRDEEIGLGHWGASLYQKTRQALAQSAVAYGAGSNLLHEASLDIISIEGFTNLLGDPVGEAAILKRMTLANLTKGSHNMLIKDKDEDFTKLTQNFAGIPDMVREYVVAISGASEIPVTRLLGLSPSGLNATGEHDLINYYDSVHSRQGLELAKALKPIDEILQYHLFGNVLKDFKYIFNSLWQPSRGQHVEMLKTSTDAYVQALEFLPPEVVLRAVKKDPYFDISDSEITAFIPVLEKRMVKKTENNVNKQVSKTE